MPRLKKYSKIDYKNKSKTCGPEDLEFIIWKAEINKELYSFWKAINK